MCRVRQVDTLIIGGGILGLAVAYQTLQDRPGSGVLVLEREDRVGTHQTGHNSGVIHSGVYYAPGSLKARMCTTGARLMTEFCQEHGVPVRQHGKLIVATGEAELPRLAELARRAAANGVTAELIGPDRAAEIEPGVTCLGALHVPGTASTDYRQVAAALARAVVAAGGEVHTGARVTAIDGQRVSTAAARYQAGTLVNCAGLHADRIAALAGAPVPARIVPFRGEYFTMRREVVRGLVYPVPDPALPFLGVHLTRMLDGSVHAGPNAVLALARHGYRWRDIDLRDIASAVGYPGLWRLARTHLGTGVAEVRRSLSRRRFAASLARLVPGITAADLLPAPAGVRAQAVAPDGRLVDDFLIVHRPGQAHVLNAPSPAATSSLALARYIVAEIAGRDPVEGATR